MKVNRLFIFILVAFLTACNSQPQVKALSKDEVIVAFGDSLTFGHGVEPSESYPAVLANMIDRKVINAGLSGEISADGLKRMPGIIENYSPQLIIICHGANDIIRHLSMQEAENNLRAMVKMAKDKDIDVVLVAVPGLNLFASSPEFYRTIAKDFNIPFEPDIIGDLEKNNRMKSDEVHFNKEGNAEIAKALKEVLTKAGALN